MNDPANHLLGINTAINDVVRVMVESLGTVTPMALRYTVASNHHAQCMQRMFCDMNSHFTERYGKPGDVAFQLVR